MARVEYLESLLTENDIEFDTRAYQFQRLGLDLELGVNASLDRFDPIKILESYISMKGLELRGNSVEDSPLMNSKDASPKHIPETARTHEIQHCDDGETLVTVRT